MTRRLDHIFNIWLITKMNICPTAKKLAKVGSTFSQKLIYPPRIYQRGKIFQRWSHWGTLETWKIILRLFEEKFYNLILVDNLFITQAGRKEGSQRDNDIANDK